MLPDILLIICDTARADAFGPWDGPLPTPSMDSLCREGISYGQAVSSAPWTLASTASLFSGKLPTEHGINGDCFEWHEGRPTSPANAVRAYAKSWLPDSLRERGYRTWGASCNTWVSQWGGFDRGFETFLDLRDRTRLPKGPRGSYARRAARMSGKLDRGGRRAVEEFSIRLKSAGEEPLFTFVNLMETHAPYDPPRPFYPFPFWERRKTRSLTGGTDKSRRFLAMNAGVSDPSSEYVRSIRNLYYHCARYADRVVGDFVRAVKDRGRPTVIAVVADHGENLGDHGLFNHNSSLHQTLLHVPLVVWGRRVEVGQGRVDEPVSFLGLPDWLVGLADGSGTPISPNGPIVSEYESTVKHNGVPADIQALMDRGDPSRVPGLVNHAGVAVRLGSRKYVALENGEQTLHELASDPGEEHDLLRSRPEAASEFASALQHWRNRRANQPRYGAGDVAEDEIAHHLRDLGYID